MQIVKIFFFLSRAYLTLFSPSTPCLGGSTPLFKVSSIFSSLSTDSIISYWGFAACQVVTEAPSLITHILSESGKKNALQREKERINGSGVIRADSVSVLPVASDFNAAS